MKKLVLLVLAGLFCASAFAAPAKVEQNNYSQKTNAAKQQQNTADAMAVKRKPKHLVVVLPSNKTPAELYDYGSAVTLSPYLGVRDAYDASDLITMLPSMNEDLILLKQRQALKNHLRDRGLIAPNRPLLEVSGHVEGQVYNIQDYNKKSKNDVDLSSVELDLFGEVSDWASGYVVLSYDKYPPMSGPRTTNSRVQVSRAMLTIGDLDFSPIYASIGQMYIPFGLYSNYMITTPLTQSIGRPKQRAVLLGYSKGPIYASIYGFKGDSHTNHNSVINQGGVNIGYTQHFDVSSLDFGGGLIANIADSDGMQTTGAPYGFPGFGTRAHDPEKLVHAVPGYNLHAKVVYHSFQLLGEYIGSLRPFAFRDLNFNGHGAHIDALDVEGAYMFKIINKPGSVALGYDRSWQALELYLPQQSYFAKFAISLWKDTIESLEYRHDVNYSKNDYYIYPTNRCSKFGPRGNSANTVTLQVGIYF